MRLVRWFFIIAFLIFVSTAHSKDSDKETPVMFKDSVEYQSLGPPVPWVKPDYTGQENALGYSVSAFAVPPEMEDRVSFWLDIYTRLTTDKGLLHDSLHVNLVYEEVDFTDIMANESMTRGQKERARRKRVNDGKKKIRVRLRKLQKLTSPAGLNGEDLRYWYMFANIKEKNKFIKASKRRRLRFQLGQRNRFIKGIFYSGRYLKQMEEIFKEKGLPIELTRLPFVESSFNIKARSKVGASGIWQIMRSTGKRLLKINYASDERNDPIRATHAAAKFLRMSFNMLNSWPLAVTGYNHGPAGVRRLVRRFKTNDLSKIIKKRRRRFGFASGNFYASFLAAIEAEKNAEKYFGPITREAPLVNKKITLSKSINYKTLNKWFDGNTEKAKLFNPHLRKTFWRGWATLRRRNFIRVPEAKHEMVVAELRKMKSNKAPNGSGRTYRVSRGETISHIAQQFGVSIRSILEMNGISNPRRIRAGQKLQIPK